MINLKKKSPFVPELNKIMLYSDFEMSLAELSEDPVFRRIPGNMIREYVDASMQIGTGAAEELKGPDGSCPDLYSVCRDKNITVNIIDREYRVGSIHFRSELLPRRRTINILRPSIASMFQQLQQSSGSFEGLGLSEKVIIDIHLAHEMYHMFETLNGRMTNHILSRITLFRIFGYEHKSTVLKTREVAAHMFCRNLLNLPFHPKNLDYLYMISRGEMTEDELKEYIMRLKNELC